MPSCRSEAPSSIPDEETIEHLLSRHNNFDKRTKSIKTITEISEGEKTQVNLVTLGKRQICIEGDPFGVYPAWAGNVGHPRDDRMFDVLSAIFDQLDKHRMQHSEEVRKLAALFEAMRNESCDTLAVRFADDQEITQLNEDANELTFTFKIGGFSVRVVHAKDLEQDGQGSYLESLEQSKRCRQAKEHLDELFQEGCLTVSAQQYVMAQILMEEDRQWPPVPKDQTDFLTRLRADADGRYWLEMSNQDRKRTEAASASPDSALTPFITRLQQSWPPSWNLGHRDRDMFHRYARDQVGIEKVWNMVGEDVLIVLDRNKKLVFSNFVGLTQVLFNQQVVDLLARALDMWSFYTPLPAPESKRHSVDHYIRKIHPELDMEKAIVADLPKAKKAVVHYGTYAMAGHMDGRRICLTRDSKFSRSLDQENSEALFPQLYSSVFGKAANIIRFMMERLDPEHYQECRSIFKKLPGSVKISTGDRDFLSLFAVGINPYTQRHRDTNDMKGGLASLVTLGNYKGGDLCLPQLGLKVRYTPGTCALMRGDSLEHLTSDFTGFRAFIVGANHETTRLHVRLREQGAAGLRPPLSPRRPRAGGDGDAHRDSDSGSEEDSDVFTTTCVNGLNDEDDEDVTYTNKELHGAGALDSESSGGSATQEEGDRGRVMSLLRTSSTLRRLFLGPAPLYKPCAPATRRVGGPSHSPTTTIRPPWAHQTRLSSSNDDGSGEDDDPYKVLGVPSDIPQSKIKPAYYAQAKKLHPDGSKRQDSHQFLKLQNAYDKLSTPEARKRHDDEVRERERERAALRAKDAAATRQAAQSKEQPRKDNLHSVGEARFVKRDSLKWMKKFQRSKEEADAQRKRDLDAQRSQRQREITQIEKEQRDREAALRDRDRQKAPAQTKASNSGTASHERNEPRSEPKSEPRTGSSPRDEADQVERDEDKREAASARKPTVSAKPESLRVAILRLSPGTTIPDVVKRLAFFAVGSVAEIQITGSGMAKLDFFTADAARKLQHLIHREMLTVNGKKVRDMFLRVSVLPVPQDPLASRVLMLTDRNDELPQLDSQHVKFILRQNGHVCPWVELNRLSRARTEVHFSSWREAEKASQILRCEFPSVPVRYAIDPATGDKETPPTFLGAIFRGTDFPDTKFWLVIRYSLICISAFLIASALWDFCIVPFMSRQGSALRLGVSGTEDSEVLNS